MGVDSIIVHDNIAVIEVRKLTELLNAMQVVVDKIDKDVTKVKSDVAQIKEDIKPTP